MSGRRKPTNTQIKNYYKILGKQKILVVTKTNGSGNDEVIGNYLIPFSMEEDFSDFVLYVKRFLKDNNVSLDLTIYNVSQHFKELDFKKFDKAFPIIDQLENDEINIGDTEDELGSREYKQFVDNLLGCLTEKPLGSKLCNYPL